jgi:polysaccharide biosynthesis PFTS motif protein
MLLLKFFSKKKASVILRANRGYEILKKKNNLELIDDLKTLLSNTKLFDNSASCISIKNIYSTEINLEKSTRQYILSRYVGGDFTLQILKSISNEDCKFCAPLPYKWLRVLTKSGIRVSYINSLLLWYYELFKHLAYSIYEILNQCKKFILSRFKNSFDYNKSYIYFDSLLESNLPFEGISNKYGILTWYFNWEKETRFDYYTHSVSTKSKIIMNDDVEIRYIKSPFPSPLLFSRLLKFILISCLKILYSLILLLLGKWWNLLLLREIFYYDIVLVNNGQGLGKRYMFHNSNWIYRPIWTFAAKKHGSDIFFYFYSTNIERFKKNNKDANCVNFWHLITWPKVLVWDKYQEQFLKNNIIDDIKIEIVGPISFQAERNLELNIPKNSIAIFDVQPVRTSYYIKLGIDQEYYVPEVVNLFLIDVLESINKVDLSAVFKRKREIGKLAHSLYTKKLNYLVNNFNFINLDPSIPAEEIIDKCVATISLPFTSTAIVANHLGKPSIFYDPTRMIQIDDNAAHGIQTINNKEDLIIWLKKLK